MPLHSTHRHRIVSLAPSATSILLGLGARNCIVGVSKWCKHVADVRGLPELGDCWSLDPKEVTALRPTLVIGSVPFKAETVGKLLEQPVTFLAENPRSLKDIYSNIHLFAAITGRQAAGEKLVARMQKRLAALSQAARRTRSRPVVYCEAWPNPRISSPPWAAELVKICGGTMAVPSGQRVTDEQVARAKPDVIVLAWTATGARSRPQSALKNSAWQNTPAVKDKRVCVVRDELLNTPALSLLEGARELFRILHPSLRVPR